MGGDRKHMKKDSLHLKPHMRSSEPEIQVYYVVDQSHGANPSVSLHKAEKFYSFLEDLATKAYYDKATTRSGAGGNANNMQGRPDTQAQKTPQLATWDDEHPTGTTTSNHQAKSTREKPPQNEKTNGSETATNQIQSQRNRN